MKSKILLVFLLLLLLSVLTLGVYAYIQSQKCDTTQQFNFFKLRCEEVNCNNNGSLSNGKCICDKGFSGEVCQYSRKINCNNRGDPVTDDKGQFSDCTCDDGFFGKNCEHSTEDCSGNGVMDVNTGSCSCNQGYSGNICQYSKEKTCNSNGTPDVSGNCQCDLGFYSSDCSLSSNSRVGFYTTSPGGLPDVCANDQGVQLVFLGTIRSIDSNGAVVDFDTVATPTCAFSKKSDETWNATYIGSSDKPGSYYPSGLIPNPIPFSSALRLVDSKNSSCNSRGTIAITSCICDQSFAGDSCQFSRKDTCSGSGNPDNNGECACDENFAGKSCEFSREVTCNGKGSPNDDGTCKCDSMYFDKDCKNCVNGKDVKCNCLGIWDPSRGLFCSNQ